jgi:hypothetical protein
VLNWYDVLGVSPGASPEEVRSAYQARARQLAPQMLAGVPAKVLKAADAAKAAADAASGGHRHRADLAPRLALTPPRAVVQRSAEGWLVGRSSWSVGAAGLGQGGVQFA